MSGSDNPDQSYLSPDGTPIENKQHLRDLGVQLSSDCTFSIHIDNVVTSVSKMLGWVLRTFRSRSKVVMMTCWSSLLQSRLDYCCQLWSPCDQASITKLEGLAKKFSSHITGMEGLDYWERLKALQMYSQERRREKRKFSHSPRRGWSAIPKTIVQETPSSVRKAREGSLAVKGAALFNICPRGLRDMASDHQDRFKQNLDSWLSEIPDQPTIPGCQRAAISNSLLHQVPMMQKEFDKNLT